MLEYESAVVSVAPVREVLRKLRRFTEYFFIANSRKQILPKCSGECLKDAADIIQHDGWFQQARRKSAIGLMQEAQR
jgi:hypothetical protein